jgi:hypothetical protein
MTLQLQRSAAVSGKEPEMGHSQEVVAHVYDVACSGPDGAGGGGATVLHINRIFKDGIGLGGIFHTAIQVYSIPHGRIFLVCLFLLPVVCGAKRIGSSGEWIFILEREKQWSISVLNEWNWKCFEGVRL